MYHTGTIWLIQVGYVTDSYAITISGYNLESVNRVVNFARESL